MYEKYLAQSLKKDKTIKFIVYSVQRLLTKGLTRGSFECCIAERRF